jgi:uncharacterized LabA/DUF88 family protein
MRPHRVDAVVDGFNLYHSVRDAIKAIQAANELNRTHTANPVPMSEQMKWLDIRRLCETYLPAIRERVGVRAELGDVHYFSAFAHHRGPEVVERHKDFLSALTIHGVRVGIAKFKRKTLECPHCRKEFQRHEEKETDVALGAKVIELANARSCDSVFLVTGDSDLRPALRLAKQINPALDIIIAFPFGRESVELKSLAAQSFVLNTKKYRKLQLPDPVTLPNDELLHRPAGW